MEPVSAKSPAPTAAPFSIEKVRASFPALEREVNGKPVAYLDSGASAQRVLASIQAVDRYERRHHSNVHRGSHTLSAEATEAYEGARATVADHIGAAWAPSATTSAPASCASRAISASGFSVPSTFDT